MTGTPLSFLCTLVALVGAKVAQIKPFSAATLTDIDVLQYDLMDYFDTSQAVGVQFSSSLGRLIDLNTTLGILDYSADGFSRVDSLQFLSNLSIALLFDQATLLIVQVEVDGITFVSNQSMLLNVTGQADCRSMGYDGLSKRLHVVCISPANQLPQNISLITVIATGTALRANTTTLDIDADKLSLRRARTAASSRVSQGMMQYIAMVYNDGYAAEVPIEDCNRAALFVRSTNGKMSFSGYLDLNSTLQPADRVLSVFPYSNSPVKFMVAYSRAQDGLSAYLDCLLTSDNQLQCDQTPRETSISRGWIGLINSGQFVMYDSEKNLVRVCGFDKDKGTHDPDDCLYYSDLPPLASEVDVHEIVGSSEQLLLQLYSRTDSSYLGALRYVGDLAASWLANQTGTFYHVISKQFYQIRSTGIEASRVINQSLLVSARNDLEYRVNYLELNVTEADSPGPDFQVEIAITKLTSIFDDLYFNQTGFESLQAFIQQPDFNVPLPKEKFRGIDLGFKFAAGDGISAVNYSSSSSADVQFRHAKGTDDLVDVIFSNENEAVTIDRSGILSFDKCQVVQASASSSIICSQQAYLYLNILFNLKHSLFKELGCSITWGEAFDDDEKQSTLVFLFQDSLGSSTYAISEVVYDMTTFSLASTIYFVTAQISSVEIYAVDIFARDAFTHFSTISKGSLGIGDFCPSTVSAVKAQDGSIFIDIFSSCLFADQRVLRVRMPNGELFSSIPINMNRGPAITCSFENEILVVGSQKDFYLYQLDPKNSMSFYSLDVAAFNFQDIQAMTCLTEVNSAVVYAFDPNTANTILVVVQGNSKFQASSRIFTSVYQTNQSYSGYSQSYAINDGDIVHWFRNFAKENSFIITWQQHRSLFLNFLPNKRNLNTSVQMNFFNEKNEASSSFQVNLVYGFTEIVIGKQKSFKNAPAEHKLSEYLNLTGHIFDLKLVNGSDSSGSFALLNRIQLESEYPVHQLKPNISNRLVKVNNFTMGVAWRDGSHSESQIEFIIQTNLEIVQRLGDPLKLGNISIIDFDFMILSDLKTAVVAYSQDLMFQTVVAVINLADGTVIDSFVSFGRASRLQLIHLDEKNEMLLFAHCDSSKLLSVFLIRAKNSSLEASLMNRFGQVHQFSAIYFPGMYVYEIFYIMESNRYKLFIKAIIFEGRQAPDMTRRSHREQDREVELPAGVEGQMDNEVLTALACGLQNSTHYYCVINFYTTFITEFVASISSELDAVKIRAVSSKLSDVDGLEYLVYKKYPGLDSVHLQATPYYFSLTVSEPDSVKHRSLIWRRACIGGTAYIFYSLLTDSDKIVLDQKNTMTITRIFYPLTKEGVYIKQAILAADRLIQLKKVRENAQHEDYISASNPFVSVKYNLMNLIEISHSLDPSSNLLLVSIICFSAALFGVIVFLYLRAVEKEKQQKKIEQYLKGEHILEQPLKDSLGEQLTDKGSHLDQVKESLKSSHGSKNEANL